MNFENPDLNFVPEKEEEEDEVGTRSKLARSAQIAAAACAVIGGVGCDAGPEKASADVQSNKDFVAGVEQLRDDMKAIESKSEKVLLQNYYSHIKSGNSAEISESETYARAVEIIYSFKKRIEGKPIQFKTKAGIPYDITIGGDRYVPFNQQSYTPEEWDILKPDALK